jgi:hypothetical protein
MISGHPGIANGRVCPHRLEGDGVLAYTWSP